MSLSSTGPGQPRLSTTQPRKPTEEEPGSPLETPIPSPEHTGTETLAEVSPSAHVQADEVSLEVSPAPAVPPWPRSPARDGGPRPGPGPASSSSSSPQQDTTTMLQEAFPCAALEGPAASSGERSRTPGVAAVAMPNELAFLLDPACNLDLLNPQVRLQGHMREDKHTKEANAQRGHFGCARQFVGYLVQTWTFQTIVLLVIGYDFIMTVISFTEALPEGHTCYVVGDMLTIFVLSTDVLARFFFEGKPFLKAPINVFELVLVPITISEILFLSHLGIPVPLLRVLRPVFRGIRIARLIARAASKTGRYLVDLRHKVSGDRIRFMQDGFDLDLAYITSQIIAMSVPAVGREAWVRNPSIEVARFLNERHGNKYLILNTTEDQSYDTKIFFGRIAQFPMDKDSVPNLEALMDLCRILDQFLRASPDHVLAVHSKNGQGRVALVIIALLIYRRTHRTAQAAIVFFEHTRIELEKRGHASTQTVDCASQRRFLEYFSVVCNTREHDRKIEMGRAVKLKRVLVLGLPNIHQVDVCCFKHPGCKLRRLKRERDGSIVTSSSGRVIKVASDSKAQQRREEKRAQRASEDREADEDDDDDEDDGEADGEEEEEVIAGDVEKGRILDRVRRVIDEATWDSHRSGCQPLCGDPIFSSYPGSTMNTNVSARVAPPKDDGLAPGAWELTNTVLSGEFRIELHRRKNKIEELFGLFEEAALPDDSKTSKKEEAGCFQRLRHRIANLCDKLKGRSGTPGDKAAKKHDKTFDGGLMVACWLHTAFLEHDEPSMMNNRRTQQNQVILYIDRFALDKGACAPRLQSHSVGLRLQLEFEVEQRKDKEIVVEEDHETRFKLTSAAHVSETYTLDWLTWVSSRIWPSFESGFRSLIDGLVSRMAESLPGPLKSLHLSHFSLGDSYPKFGPITASSRNHDGFEVQLDIVLDYSTQTTIVLDTSFASFAISHLKIHGVLSLKFKPILPELPVFTAMQMLFLNSPNIDLKFARTLEIANSSFVRKMIFSAINKGVGDLMVLPNIMNINWADPSDMSDKTVTFRNVLPCAILRLGIVEARALTTDSSMFRNLPDAFAKGQLGAQVTQTRTIKQNANPVWGQEYDLLLYDERQFVSVSVYDIDLAGMSSCIGGALDLKVSDIILAGQDGKWVDLLPQKGQSRSQVLLKAKTFDLIADPRRIEAYCTKLNQLQSEATMTKNLAAAIGTNSRRSSPDAEQAAIPEEDTGEATQEIEVYDGIELIEGHAAVTTTREAGAVVLLTCECLGGRLPGDNVTPKDLVLKVSIGEAEAEKPCSEAPPPDPGTMGERTQKAIARLAAASLTADVIAEALGESEAEVYRVMRKQGWNLECSQKICVLAHSSDMASARNIQIQAVTVRKHKLFGKGSVPLGRVLEATNARHNTVVSCIDELGSIVLEADLELRLYALKEQSLETEAGRTVVV